MAFPNNVKQFIEAKDPETIEDMQNIMNYQNELMKGNFSTAQSLLASMKNGIEMNISAGRFNEVIETVEAIEQFYYGLNGVKEYINTNINAFSDIALYNTQTNYVIGTVASDGNQWFICKQPNGPSTKIIQPKVTENWKEYWDFFIKNQKQYPIQREEPTDQEVGDIYFKIINIID